MYFALEIIDCENGYIVLEGNSLLTNSSYTVERKKWVASNSQELSELIKALANKAKPGEEIK